MGALKSHGHKDHDLATAHLSHQLSRVKPSLASEALDSATLNPSHAYHTLGNRAVTTLVQRGGTKTTPGCLRLIDRNLLQLQHLVGNNAVARLVQREEREAPEQALPEDFFSPLSPDLRGVALGLIQSGREFGRPDVVLLGRTFLATGQLKVLTLQTGVMAKPQFLGHRVDLLRRGESVTVLERQAAWCKVLTKAGKIGWIHYNRLFPKLFRIRSGETGSGGWGSGPREAVIAGRG
ncbi:MAG: SH3 domain-containing protein [Anaerolineae bacterium]